MNLAKTKIVKELRKHGGDVVKFISKNSPAILTGGAIICAFTAVGLAVKATLTVDEDIHEEKRKHLERLIITNGDEGVTEEEKEELIDDVVLTKTEVAKAVWKRYVPTGIALVGVTACCIGAQGINAKRTAAMAALYQMSETALKEYKDKSKDLMGKGKADKIADALAEDKVNQHPFTADTQQEMGVGAPGDVRCFEPISGRYFWSTADKINRAMNALNTRMISGEVISENEWFYEISAGRLMSTQYGDNRGWNADHQIDVHFTSSLMSDGTPVLVVGHNNDPFGLYRDF